MRAQDREKAALRAQDREQAAVTVMARLHR